MKVIEWFDTGIFPATVLFSCGFSYDELIKELNKNKATDWAYGISQDKELIDGGCWFGLKRTFKNKSHFYIIITEKFKFEDEHYCKLAHEILHICQFFLPDVLDRDREIEAEAYLHTYLMRKCLKSLR